MGLFALPVPRRMIALAKLAVALAWCVLVRLLAVAALAVVGVASGLGAPDGDALPGLAGWIGRAVLIEPTPPGTGAELRKRALPMATATMSAGRQCDVSIHLPGGLDMVL